MASPAGGDGGHVGRRSVEEVRSIVAGLSGDSRSQTSTTQKYLQTETTLQTPFSARQDVEEHQQKDFENLVESALETEGTMEPAASDATSMAKAASIDRVASLQFALPVADKGEKVVIDINALHKAEPAMRRALIDSALATQDQDNLRLLTNMRKRMDRAGVKLSNVLVKYENLHVQANVQVGNAGMPTVLNSFKNTGDEMLTTARIKSSNRTKFTLLNNISGVLKPGRLTLLLGPPGSGKTTMLKTLAGVLVDGKEGLKITGQITYNGETFDKFYVRRTSAYIDQVDTHLAELTVRETLDFAARCLGPGHKPEYLEQIRALEKDKGISPDPEVDAYLKALLISGKRHSISTDLMLRILGLEVCSETFVGNQLIRGVSGGQKKRVTTGEMVVGPAKTLFMDEISTGLDSSTTFLVVQCMRNFVHLQDGTILMALLQPPPEVYDLFDDVLLLSEGNVAYHGPIVDIVSFFYDLGFKIPERKGVADFLQEVTSRKDQWQYWHKSEEYQFMPVKHIADSFKTSKIGRGLDADVAIAWQAPEGHVDPLVREKYALNSFGLFKALLRRDFTIMQRNYFLYCFRAFQVTWLAFCISTLLIKPRNGTSSVQDGNTYLAVLFYSIAIMLFNGYTELSITVESLPVFYKQRNNLFFPAWAFALPTTVLRLPLSVSDAFLWSIVVYWSVGFAPEASRFFIFYAYMILMHQFAMALFKLTGAIGRKFDYAHNYGSLVLALVMLMGGFVLARQDMHPWVVWIYWINPAHYIQTAVSINEFLAPRWSTPTTINGVTAPLGIQVLNQRGIPTESWWLWACALFMIGFIALLNALHFLVLTVTPQPHENSTLFSEEFMLDREMNTVGSTAGYEQQKQMKKSKSLMDIVKVGQEDKSAKNVAFADTKSMGKGSQKSLADIDVTARVEDDVPAQRSASNPNQKVKGMALEFHPMAMAFRNICYSVQVPADADSAAAAKAAGEKNAPTKKLQLLTNITGAFKPGTLTALMGVSGAGKTTLMDVLCGRKTAGVVEGEVFVGGYPKEQSTFARVSGYVEQNDIHMPRTTVREALVVSATLRLYNVDRKSDAIERFVDDVMELVELHSIRDSLVGIPGEFGLSVEQRKRLTIAVELVANPSIIFMDEPTSGLDARAAAIVMRTVRNTVNTGRTVVCTIHQPSIDIFDAFDELLLLRRGGHTMYYGPTGRLSVDLISYFEGIQGVRKIRDGINPATWMLEVSTVGAEKRLGKNFADIYQQSELAKKAQVEVEELFKPGPTDKPLHFDTEYAADRSTQYKVLIWRAFIQYWRFPNYNSMRIIFATLLGLLLGAIYWGLGKKPTTQNAVFNVVGALFITIAFLATNNGTAIQPILAMERPVFYRERAANMYAVAPYSIAVSVVEIPWNLLQAVIYGLITYFMIQFQITAAKFWWYILFISLSLLAFTFFGMAVMSVMPGLVLANIATYLMYGLLFMQAGFFAPQPLTPGWWIWFYWCNPLTYTLYGTITSQLGDYDNPATDSIQLSDGSYNTIAGFLNQSYGYEHSFLKWAALILAAFVLFFWALTATALKTLNFLKR